MFEHRKIIGPNVEGKEILMILDEEPITVEIMTMLKGTLKLVKNSQRNNEKRRDGY